MISNSVEFIATFIYKLVLLLMIPKFLLDIVAASKWLVWICNYVFISTSQYDFLESILMM